MLKTKPKWMRWNALHNAQKKNSVVDADTPPVDANEDERADLTSALESAKCIVETVEAFDELITSDSVTKEEKKKLRRAKRHFLNTGKKKLPTKTKPKTKSKPKRKVKSKKYEFKLPDDIFKNGEFSLNRKVNDIGGVVGKRSAKSSITLTKRTSNYTSETLNGNRDDAKYYRRSGSSWKLNKKPERSAFSYDALHNRKLGSTLALLFSKIAEERMGDKIIGEDKWDVEDIMFRRVSKKVITNCKYTREKKHLILVLDSSPSCKDMAQTYSEIATESAMFDDVEIYDAPNGYAHSIYDPLRKDFVHLNDEELDAMYLWNCLQGRTIIYFGDEDAVRSIDKSRKHNEIHWFYKSYSSYDKDAEYYRLIERYKDKKNITIYKCNDTKQLMEAVRNIK
jgi:hypothetical protein